MSTVSIPANSRRLICSPVGRWLVGFVILLALLSFLRLAGSNLQQIDFSYIYTAGTVWSQGLDPYGPDFARLGQNLPGAPIWAYPPQWWAIATALAALDPGPAYLAWRVANIALLAIGSVLLWRTSGDKPHAAAPPFALAGFVFFLADSEATAAALGLGQTSIIAFAGIALFVAGAGRKDTALAATGLVLLLLKPQFGIMFMLFALCRRELRRPALIAGITTALLTVPVLAQFGIAGSIESASRLLDNLAIYSTVQWNRPLELAGLSFLIAAAGGPGLSSFVYIGAAAVIAVLSLDDRWDARDIWIVMVSTALFLIPLRGYDFVIAASLVLVIDRYQPWARLCVLLGLALLWRPGAVSALFDQSGLESSAVAPVTIAYIALYTAGGLLFFVSAIWGRRPPQPLAARVAPGE